MLYYPTFYEGLEASKNVVYTGQEAVQQILWGLDWAYENLDARILSYWLRLHLAVPQIRLPETILSDF